LAELDKKHIPRMLTASGVQPDTRRCEASRLRGGVLGDVRIAIDANGIESIVVMYSRDSGLDRPQNTGHCNSDSISTNICGRLDARSFHRPKKDGSRDIGPVFQSWRGGPVICPRAPVSRSNEQESQDFPIVWLSYSQPEALLPTAKATSFCLVLRLPAAHSSTDRTLRFLSSVPASSKYWLPDAISQGNKPEVFHTSPAPLFRLCMQRRSMVSHWLVHTPQA
jgi:hypothetical protein